MLSLDESQPSATIYVPSTVARCAGSRILSAKHNDVSARNKSGLTDIGCICLADRDLLITFIHASALAG